MATQSISRRPQAKTCPCCGDRIDCNDECACFCVPDPNLSSCHDLPECHYTAATQVMILGQWYTKEAGSSEPPIVDTPQTQSPLSPTLEAELAELVAERDLEAEPFHMG